MIHQAHVYPCPARRLGWEEIVERVDFHFRPSPAVKIDFLDQRIQDSCQRPIGLLCNRHLQISKLRFFGQFFLSSFRNFLFKKTLPSHIMEPETQKIEATDHRLRIRSRFQAIHSSFSDYLQVFPPNSFSLFLLLTL